MPNFVLKAVEKNENTARHATFLAATKEGLNPDEAAARVRKIFPMYGNPRDESVTTGDNRPLPPELRGRIDRWRKKYGATQLQQRSATFDTFNAFVRAEIRKGNV